MRWRRFRYPPALVRLWDKDFNHIGTLPRGDERVESWGHYFRRLWWNLTPWWLIAMLPLLLIPLAVAVS